MNIFRKIFKNKSLNQVGRSAKLILVSTVIFGALDSLWQLFYNLFVLSRGFGKEFLGLVNAMPYIGFLTFAVLAGIFTNRVGKRKALIIGLAVQISALALQLILPSKILILFSAFCVGAGLSLVIVSKLPLLHESSSKENQALIFSLNFALYGFVGMGGNLVAGQLPALLARLLNVPEGHAITYQTVLIISVLLGFLCILPIYKMKEETPKIDLLLQESEKHESAKFFDLLFSPLVIKLCLPCLTLGFGAGILLPFMNVFFVE
nr:MFS transporter [Anaerolineaceae bacterium]